MSSPPLQREEDPTSLKDRSGNEIAIRDLISQRKEVYQKGKNPSASGAVAMLGAIMDRSITHPDQLPEGIGIDEGELEGTLEFEEDVDAYNSMPGLKETMLHFSNPMGPSHASSNQNSPIKGGPTPTSKLASWDSDTGVHQTPSLKESTEMAWLCRAVEEIGMVQRAQDKLLLTLSDEIKSIKDGMARLLISHESRQKSIDCGLMEVKNAVKEAVSTIKAVTEIKAALGERTAATQSASTSNVSMPAGGGLPAAEARPRTTDNLEAMKKIAREKGISLQQYNILAQGKSLEARTAILKSIVEEKLNLMSF